MKKLLLILLLFFPVHGAWGEEKVITCQRPYGERLEIVYLEITSDNQKAKLFNLKTGEELFKVKDLKVTEDTIEFTLYSEFIIDGEKIEFIEEKSSIKNIIYRKTYKHIQKSPEGEWEDINYICMQIK